MFWEKILELPMGSLFVTLVPKLRLIVTLLLGRNEVRFALISKPISKEENIVFRLRKFFLKFWHVHIKVTDYYRKCFLFFLKILTCFNCQGRKFIIENVNIDLKLYNKPPNTIWSLLDWFLRKFKRVVQLNMFLLNPFRFCKGIL